MLNNACAADERSMSALFKDALHEAFGTRLLGYTPYGGAEYGEVRAVAEAVGAGDDSRYHEVWLGRAARLEEEADAALAKGHVPSARALYLRASVFYAASLTPLYGAPADPRLIAAFRMQIATFDQGLALGLLPIRPQRIPFGDLTLPAYLIPAAGHEAEVGPLIIFNNGYDATVTDMFFASAVAASHRGYHSLLFDGPGQGGMLFEQGVPLRPDWETVIAAVLDFAATQPLVDPARIALSGWSLGGYLAPRAAAGEPRIAALIADPPLWSVADEFRVAIRRMFNLPAEAVQDLGALDQAIVDRLDAAIRKDREFNWKVIRRGCWARDIASLDDYLAASELFTMAGRAKLIRCPTLITEAENDPLAAGAGTFFAVLDCPKTLLHFTAEEGADGHCEMHNRSLLNRRALDWLDERLGKNG